MNWFNVDKSGLAAILERRGKSFILFELVSNAWDAGATRVDVRVEPIPGSPFAKISVEDDSPTGWTNFEHAFTLFARSDRASKPDRRGRFNLGEKLVLSCARAARIETMNGTLVFDEDGRHKLPHTTRTIGTMITAEIRITRDEIAEMELAAFRMVPPVPTSFNGREISRPEKLKTFVARLPTEIAREADGVLARSTRIGSVDAYAAPDGDGWILELGVPVCPIDCPFVLDVGQKVPLGFERDSVTAAFRRALQVAAMNELADKLTPETAAAPWSTEAIADSRVAPAALARVIELRFGDRAVVAVPGDPIANATAEASGCSVIHGGALPAGAWENMRKNATIPTTSAAFPTPKPAAGVPVGTKCPLCKQPIEK